MQEVVRPAEIATSGAALFSFIGYLVVVIGIGVYATRFSSAGVSEFFVGGRKMNRVVVALSAVVSGRSGWLLLGVTGLAYTSGPSAVWAVVGYIVVELFLFLFYAGRLRRFSEKYDCITLPDFFAARFGDRNGLLRSVLTFVILVFMVSYVSSQFVSGGKTFAASFDISENAGIIVTAVIVLLYTALGGFLAVSLTDMLQAFFMIFALVVIPAVAITERGGLATMLDQLQALDPAMVDPFAIAFGAAIGFVGIGLGSPGNPHILVRYMSIKDPGQLRYSAVVGTLWNVVMAWGAVFIGLVGRASFPDIATLPNQDAETIYPILAQQYLHPIIFGIAVASIFAAVMSTADSQLLVGASSVVRDIYERLIHQGETLPQRRLVWYSRAVVVALVVIALVLGFLVERVVLWFVLFAWGGLGAAIGPPSILALYWRGTTRAGVLAGLITGTTVTIAWETSATLSPLLYELIPAFAASLVATVLVSRITSPPEGTAGMFEAMGGSHRRDEPR